MTKFYSNITSQVELVAPKSIRTNVLLENLYRLPNNYELIKQNIQVMGIITPLIVNSNNSEIISGNLRYRIANELGQGRKFIGYEPSPEYMVASKIRMSEYELVQVA